MSEDAPTKPGKYPKRQKFFVARVIRILVKECVAQELGPAAAMLITTIASTEDTVGYRRAVTFYDGQLLPILGVDSTKTLYTIRKKCVASGWLHYEHGRKGVPGKYWVTIPASCEDLDDYSTDEGHDDDTEDSQRLPGKNYGANAGQRNRNGGETESQRNRNGSLSSLIPIPNTKEENAHPSDAGSPSPATDESPPSGEEPPETKPPEPVPEKLAELITAWNATSKVKKVAKPDSSELRKAWARVQKDPVSKQIFDDVPTLIAKIRGSPFLLENSNAWFKFLWLFAKAPDRIQWNVSKIMEGNYEGIQNGKRSPSQQSAGQHDPEKPITW